MAHKLRPVLRLDAEMRSAVVELHGCLTEPATGALLRILDKGRTLNPKLTLSLDLRPALHIEPASLAKLQLSSQTAEHGGWPCEVTAYLEGLGPLQVLLPPALPICPAERALARRQDRYGVGGTG